jgi:S1-C subfamily serine protease
MSGIESKQVTGSSPGPGKQWPERLRLVYRRRWLVVPFATGVLATLVAFLLYSAFVPGQPQLTLDEVNDSIAQALASATPPPAFSASVYQVIRPSLVFIQTETQDSEAEEARRLGSGVVINDAGDILTSLHVVEEASAIEVAYPDGTIVSAELIVEQPENDIAVLRASQPPEMIVPAMLGNPGAMRVGDEAYAVGNPFGLYGSMTAGVISGFDRSFQPPDSERRLEGLIQIDAAVNPGNSGGPLLNRSGQVVGIVVGIINPTEQEVFVGIGFAVPIQVAASAAGLPSY